ncbi:uncharacterized protein JCM10292_004814 [Rhodotorula paludigena]|uniref:uncharacterized protein n=1 Tax=Rhodotorula paludigena TaxID=86838 RepID=UPI0031797CBC
MISRPPSPSAPQLPLEDLLPLILPHLAPLTALTPAYCTRQSALAACCRVSKLFHSVARPLLDKVVRVDSEAVSKMVVDAFGRAPHCRRVKVLLVIGFKGTGEVCSAGKLAMRFARLEELWLIDLWFAEEGFDEDEVSLSDLALLSPDLWRLVLYNVEVTTGGGDYTMPRLIDLTTVECGGDGPDELLKPETTPSLRLDFLQLTYEDICDSQDSVQHFLTGITLLVSFEVDATFAEQALLPYLRHLLLDTTTVPSIGRTRRHPDLALDTLEQDLIPRAPVQTILLPRGVCSDTASSWTLTPARLDNFLQTCKQKEITVIWYDDADGSPDAMLPPRCEFREIAKRLKNAARRD